MKIVPSLRNFPDAVNTKFAIWEFGNFVLESHARKRLNWLRTNAEHSM